LSALTPGELMFQRLLIPTDHSSLFASDHQFSAPFSSVAKFQRSIRFWHFFRFFIRHTVAAYDSSWHSTANRTRPQDETKQRREMCVDFRAKSLLVIPSSRCSAGTGFGGSWSLSDGAGRLLHLTRTLRPSSRLGVRGSTGVGGGGCTCFTSASSGIFGAGATTWVGISSAAFSTFLVALLVTVTVVSAAGRDEPAPFFRTIFRCGTTSPMIFFFVTGIGFADSSATGITKDLGFSVGFTMAEPRKKW